MIIPGGAFLGIIPGGAFFGIIPDDVFLAESLGYFLVVHS